MPEAKWSDGSEMPEAGDFTIVVDDPLCPKSNEDIMLGLLSSVLDIKGEDAVATLIRRQLGRDQTGFLSRALVRELDRSTIEPGQGALKQRIAKKLKEKYK